MALPTFRTPVNYSGIYDATSLITHIESGGLTVAVNGYFEATDGTQVGVTTHTRDMSSLTGYSGVTFKSTAGITASRLSGKGGTDVNDMESDLILSAAGITEAQVLAGKWKKALAVVFLVNYETPTMGQLIVHKGYLSEFTQVGELFRSAILGFKHALGNQVVRLCRPECDADLGDARCGLDLVALGFVKTGTVTTGGSQTQFTDTGRSEGADYFNNGVGTWTSGNNNGLSFEVETYNSGTKVTTLRMPTPYTIAAGDTYSMKRGCQKRFDEDCVAIFNNALGFRGFPHVPGLENINRLPLQ